jgi:NAD(P)H-hydrate repair Nnr-like enzyme with NAD(P)H-hydrate dehydratase domain
VRSGTSALATAGTGDVLAGMIGGAISRGFSALDSAALAAHLHGLAGQRLGIYAGASELPQAVGDVLEDLRHGGNNGG